MYTRLEENETRPIGNAAQTPAMQTRQQANNVQQVSIQRPADYNENRRPNRE